MKNQLSNISQIVVSVVLAMVLAMSLVGCEGEDGGDNQAAGAGGMLSRDGDAPIPLFITNTDADVTGNETTTVYLTNRLTTFQGPGSSTSEQVQSISLTIPLDQLGQEIQLNGTNAEMSENPPSVGILNPPIPADFQSTSAVGTATVFYAYEGAGLLDPDHGSGFFQVTFTDDDGNTRAITGGFFNF